MSGCANLSGESVAAENENVAEVHLLEGEIDLHGRLGSERLQVDVAALADFSFFRGELAGFDELLHQRLVFS